RGKPLRAGSAPMQRALRGEAVRQERVWIRRPDGSRRALSISCTPLTRRDGAPAGAVCVGREETERLLLEQERNRTLALLDSVLAASPVGLAFLDPSLRFLRVNQMLADLDGQSVQEHLGRVADEILPPEWGEWMTEAVRKVLKSGDPILGVD